MNKKEISEIKKLFGPNKCCLTKICGCYVSHEKEKIMVSKNTFLSLPDEEAFKYFDIFKKTLSGKIGKTLYNLSYPTKTDNELQKSLIALKDTKLTDDEVLEAFYDKVIETYTFAENYFIILAHGVYDVPGKTSDDTLMEDASEEVYSHIICSICPVQLDTPGLTYSSDDGRFTEKIRSWLVNKPMTGFLFPSFTDRTSNVHEILYYNKDTKVMNEEFITDCLGTNRMLSYQEQVDCFRDAIPKDISFEKYDQIQESINEIAGRKEDSESESFTPEDMNKLLTNVDMETECEMGCPITLGNVSGKKKIKLSDAVIAADETCDLSIQLVNGRKCLVIPINGIEMEYNGVTVAAD